MAPGCLKRTQGDRIPENLEFATAWIESASSSTGGEERKGEKEADSWARAVGGGSAPAAVELGRRVTGPERKGRGRGLRPGFQGVFPFFQFFFFVFQSLFGKSY